MSSPRSARPPARPAGLRRFATLRANTGATLLALLSGALYCAAFPNFDLWPLCFVALVPLMLCLDVAPSPAAARWCAGIAGLVATQARGYFLVDTLANFSGFPWALCALISLLLCAYQGGQLVLFLWLLQKARERRLWVGAVAPLAFATTEFTYPRLFHSYLANALHGQPLALQVVDLGGAGLLSMAVVLVNGALYELLRTRTGTAPPAPARDAPGTGRAVRPAWQMLTAAAISCWAFVVGYGHYRTDELGARMAAADKRTVGVVQANAGMFDKRKHRRRYYLRHYNSSRALEKEHALDLLVWPETAVQHVRDTVATHGALRTPLLFGTHLRRNEDGQSRLFNSAMLTAADGRLLGTYDKRYLLPFGEYLPLGQRFPILHRWSPHSGRFTAGHGSPVLELDGMRIAPLICYEDVVPDFVRGAVLRGRPHLLVNMTNDAWFGETNAPWLHLALAKLRAVEHHRYLVRATNNGVSVVVDPAGRVIARAPSFDRARMAATVSLLQGQTVYGRLGDWPGLLSLLLCLGMLALRPRHGCA